jgi:preprotein translocase subunit YajC
MPTGFDLPTILLLVGVVAVFYLMLVRPQQKRAKEQQKLMTALAAGDRVMTISGIVGTIRYLGEKQAIIEISPGVEMTVVKGAISSQPVEDEFEYAEDGTASALTEPDTVTETETPEAETAVAETDESAGDAAAEDSK